MTSRVSAVMLARIGPVKPFLPKCLITHSEACGRAEDGPPTRSSHTLPQKDMRRIGESSAARGNAQRRERGQREDRRRHAASQAVLVEGPAPQRARSARASRPKDRNGGGAAYRLTSLVSAEKLAGIGPVKPFLYKALIAHGEACGRTEKEPPTRSRALAQRSRLRVGGEPGRAKGTHRYASAVSAEIVGGTLPTRPG
jgi:hypothetical protein